MSHTTRQQKTIEQAMLYRVVYGGKLPRFAAVLLFLFFTIQPTTQALGAEEEVAAAEASAPEPEETPAEPEEEVVEEEVVEEAVESDEVASEERAEEESVVEETEIEVPTEEEEGEIVAEEEVANPEETTLEDIEVPTQEGTEIVIETESEPETIASSTPAVEETTDGGGSGSDSEISTEEETETASSTEATVKEETVVETELESTSEEEIVEEEAVETTQDEEVDTSDDAEEERNPVQVASSSEETVTPAPEYFEIGHEVSHSDAHYQFQKTQCVSMGDGGYYCAEKKLMSPEDTETDSLYTALDEDGDLEIYLRNNGKVEQITDNSYDDAAPYYDPVSDSIVWHRLIQGRYQVMNFEGKDEEQITSSRNNSMEPKRSGDYIVWQEWIGDDWEVMLYDGNEIKQLTDNEIHDMAPYVQNGYVIWTKTDGETKSVSVYDIASGLASSIGDSDGGRVENPRFVLVYDEKLDNGDVITKGFNPDTGEVAPLSAQPGSVPEGLPQPDSTGETRALIQNKPGAREDFAEEIEIGTASDTTDVVTSSEDVVVDDSALLELDAAEAEVATTTDVLPLTDFDIIVEPFSATSSAQGETAASTTDAVE